MTPCVAHHRRLHHFASFASRGLAGAALAILSGCASDAGSAGATSTADVAATGGNLVISAFADPDVLLPPLTMTAQGLQVVDAVFDRLVQPQIGANGETTYEPALATRWSWSPDSLALDFVLHDQARWHDGKPVTANDVRFTWQAYVDSLVGSPAASALQQIDSVQVRDDATVRVWFARRTPDQFSDAVRHMHILPAHLLDTVPRASWRTSAFSRAPIGSGRFRFRSWEAGSRLELVADSTNYRGRPQLDRVIWTVSPDPNAAALRLYSGDADFLEFVRPDAAGEFAAHPNVALLTSPSLIYGFLQFNLTAPGATARAHPVLGEPATRRALSMAIDRALVVQAVFDSLARVALGPVTRIQLGADTLLPAIPFDTARASRMLDSIGWRRAGANGVRMRDGKPLAFTTLVPSSSSQRGRIAVLMQQMLERVGVQMNVEKVEFNTLNARLSEGKFDAAVMAMSADPKLSGIRGVWGSEARAPNGANFGRYASARFDALLDSAQVQMNEREARRLYGQAYGVIVDDAPAIWLYEPFALSGISRAVRAVGLRPDGWWLQLAEWRREPIAK